MMPKKHFQGWWEDGIWKCSCWECFMQNYHHKKAKCIHKQANKIHLLFSCKLDFVRLACLPASNTIIILPAFHILILALHTYFPVILLDAKSGFSLTTINLILEILLYICFNFSHKWTHFKLENELVPLWGKEINIFLEKSYQNRSMHIGYREFHSKVLKSSQILKVLHKNDNISVGISTNVSQGNEILDYYD